MNLKLTLIVIGCIGIFSACGEAPKKEDIQSTKVLISSDSETKKSATKNSETNSSKKEDNLTAEMEKLENQQKKLSLMNTLDEENLKSKHKELLIQLQEIKWEKEMLSEKLELQKAKDEKENYENEKKDEAKKKKFQDELDDLEHQSKLSELKASQLASEISLEQSAIEFKKSKLDSELSFLEAKKNRDNYITAKAVYLDNPLSEDNQTLTISDRRIDLNGVIEEEMAARISQQIDYFNNKDSKKPIFLVIDRSPGGEVMAGNIILRSIKSSEAPVYVVVKTFVASMAAVIVTLADESFAYPEAVILHHQIMAFSYGMSNLTEEKEKYNDLKKMWDTFGTPIATKMGISPEEFIKQMYANSLKGNWKEFAVEAQKLKWIKRVITRIIDKSVVVNPLHEDENSNGNYEEDDDDSDYLLAKPKPLLDQYGKPFIYLPRLTPTDAYFIYNPDGYYRMR